MTKVATGSGALELLRHSTKVQQVIDEALIRARDAGINISATTPICRLAVQPFVAYDVVPYGRAVVVIEAGTVYCTVQRDADVNASLTRLSDEDAAALQSEGDQLHSIDLKGTLPTQHAVLTARIENRTNRWLHQFAMAAKLHLMMAGRGSDTVCFHVALPHLGSCVQAWLQGREIRDEELPTVAVQVLSTPPHNVVVHYSLYPRIKPKSEGEVRWRRVQNVQTPHLPLNWQRLLGVDLRKAV